MIHYTDTQKMLYRARLQLEEGQCEAALLVLQDIRTEEKQQLDELAYLLGWCYIQRKQWEAAIHVLSPLLKQTDEMREKESLAERERSALSLLHLGVAAVNLAHYEDASQHFTLCLKILHDRRIHLPPVRIRARYFLAMTYLMRGLYSAAIQHYEDALRLCRHYHAEDELPDIYHGLCGAYRAVGDYVRAYLSGQDALALYQQNGDQPKEGRMQNALGHIRLLLGDYREAGEHYTESLAIATSCQRPTMVMLNCADLADLRLAEGRLVEAKRYCHLALDTMNRNENTHMSGRTYLVIGKVIHAEARTVEGEKRATLLEEAMHWFEKAKEQLAQTQAYPEIAEVYGAWAQVLEDMGHTQQAIECWRVGYEALSRQKESK